MTLPPALPLGGGSQAQGAITVMLNVPVALLGFGPPETAPVFIRLVGIWVARACREMGPLPHPEKRVKGRSEGP